MRIFVTGGTGFIGAHAVRELERRGHTSLLLARKAPPAQKKISLLRGDLANIGKFEKNVKKFKPDAVLHLAWEGIPDYSPEMSLKNLEHGIEVMRLAKLVGAKKVLMSGSCWEYGAAKGALKEDDGLRVKNAFSAAKTALHYMSAEFAQKNGIDFIWARFFYVYGPGQKSHSLIPHLIERKRAGLPPDLKTPGAANDFVYVGDVARALAMILEKHKPSQSNTYNIGSGRLSAVKDVVNQIYKKSIVKAKKVPGFYADVSLIKKEIGWKPRTSLKAGIRATIGE